MTFVIETPETTDELFRVISRNLDGSCRFGAGYTDLVLELKREPRDDLRIINLGRLNDTDFTAIQWSDSSLRIGALTTIEDIISEKELRSQFAVLTQAAESLASRQIRAVATVGGNICTASPAGDMSCALVALKAQCEILTVSGDLHTVPIEEFFAGVKETVLKKDQVLRSVVVPLYGIGDHMHSGFIKVGVRNAMEIGIVSLAYHVMTDNDGIVMSSGVAIGSVAPTVRFARKACDFLMGKNLLQIANSEREQFADRVLESASPISDMRASAWYRRQVLWNISSNLFNT